MVAPVLGHLIYAAGIKLDHAGFFTAGHNFVVACQAEYCCLRKNVERRTM